MRYIVDHDYHIHSNISPCANDPLQTGENILKYAVQNNLKRIVVTDHFWDTDFSDDAQIVMDPVDVYQKYGVDVLSKILPLPQTEGVEFLFGCECDMDADMNIGLAKSNYDKFDFIVVATTHLHFWIDKGTPFDERLKIYIDRFNALLDSDLPFHKVGVAHLTDSLIDHTCRETHIKLLDAVSDEIFTKLFTKAAKVGLGIELNFKVSKYTPEELASILRPYKIAKKCGCKFYLGSDSHTQDGFIGVKENFEKIVDLLKLEESDKFTF